MLKSDYFYWSDWSDHQIPIFFAGIIGWRKSRREIAFLQMFPFSKFSKSIHCPPTTEGLTDDSSSNLRAPAVPKSILEPAGWAVAATLSKVGSTCMLVAIFMFLAFVVYPNTSAWQAKPRHWNPWNCHCGGFYLGWFSSKKETRWIYIYIWEFARETHGFPWLSVFWHSL